MDVVLQLFSQLASITLLFLFRLCLHYKLVFNQITTYSLACSKPASIISAYECCVSDLQVMCSLLCALYLMLLGVGYIQWEALPLFSCACQILQHPLRKVYIRGFHHAPHSFMFHQIISISP